MNEEKYLEEIKKVFNKPINDYKVISGSYGNTVIEINKKWIFRFSKSEMDIKQLTIEKSFLPQFNKLCSISIPNIEYEGENFIGYKKIEGIPLSPDIYSKISSGKKIEICKSIWIFLTGLHSVEFSNNNLVAFPYLDDNFWINLWNPIEFKLSETVRKNAFKYFTDYFEQVSKNPIKQTICHADFHPNHLLYDSSNQNISGIIDFGRLSFNDPAVDFNLIERFYWDEAVTEILKYYKYDTSKNFRERITFQNNRRLFAAIHIAKIVGEESELPRYIRRIEDVFS